MLIAKEVRERIRKKDEPEVIPKGGKPPAKGAPVKGKEDPKAKGGKAAPVQQQVDAKDEKNMLVLPEPENHVNNEIKEFLRHFKRERLIHITCEDKDNEARKRSDEEKEQI